ncbi:hypothetical protein KGF56_001573 [Candida oxycetoniae]|uniref:RRN6 beta-propeller domain-containing protein n=1 Tax=Candida oxycetoniae TaxID=497107 RepID=A0AAI9SZA1_9ASCO|nr:uncharacterized protein KGF56_001573 [Candida oxycetoniae]KAI3405555.2 hypothetical protein KGF56_001573 [Candida oxycetoniae]
MWPHKRGLGTRLSYGVDGNVISCLNEGDGFQMSNLELESVFPRHREFADTFTVDKKTIKVLTSTNSVDEQIVRFGNSLDSILSKEYIPNRIASSFKVETRAITSSMAYDPNCGDLFKLFKVCSNSNSNSNSNNENKSVKSSNALAYVYGESRSVMCVSLISQENESKSIQLIDPFQVDFLERIQQIEVSASKIITSKVVLLVRTDTNVTIITCKLSDCSTRLKVKIVKKINFEESARTGSIFAHGCFCQQNYRKLALVDVNGRLTTWQLSKGLTKVRKLNSNEMDLNLSSCDADEFSNWINICWPCDNDTILLLTRTKISKLYLRGDVTMTSPKLLITSNTWSRIRHFCTQENEAFLLTSKEFIWLNFEKNNLQRVLSWKHFLNENDPSLKFDVLHREDYYLIYIYSQVSPLIITLTFGYKDGRPCSLRDPYLINEFVDSTKQLATMWNDEKKETILLLHSTPNLLLKTCFLTRGTKEAHDSEITRHAFVREPEHLHLSFRGRRRMQNIHHKISISNQDHASEEQSIESIHKYALELNKKFNQIHKSTDMDNSCGYFSLYYLDECIPLGLSDIHDLDDMISDLHSSSITNNVQIKNLVYNSLIRPLQSKNASTPPENHIISLFHLLETNYSHSSSKVSITNTAIVLGLSLIKCLRNSANFEDRFKVAKAQSSSSVQQLLDSWDDYSNSNSNTPIDATGVVKRHKSKMRTKEPTLYLGASSQTLNPGSQKQKTSNITNSQASQLNPSQSHIGFPSSSNTTALSFSQQLESGNRTTSSMLRESQGNSQSGSQLKRKKKKRSGF